MLNVKGFFDYGISEQCLVNDKYNATIKLLYDFGYRTIAINQVIEGNDSDVSKNKKKKKNESNQEPVPEPFKIISVPGCEDMKILNRLTVEFANQDVLHKITKSPNYKKYDIIAALPTTVGATLFTCSTFEADIFCFNPENKSNVRRNRKMYNQLIDRGFHFEIPYGPAIEDTSKRKNIIHTAHLYHTFGKSRNVIISSLTTHSINIRSPYDIINLALIFGLNEQQAKNAITHCGRQVFINSVGRRHGKAVMFVENIETTNEQNSDSVVLLESDDDEMDVEQPALKKIKTIN